MPQPAMLARVQCAKTNRLPPAPRKELENQTRIPGFDQSAIMNHEKRISDIDSYVRKRVQHDHMRKRDMKRL